MAVSPRFRIVFGALIAAYIIFVIMSASARRAGGFINFVYLDNKYELKTSFRLSSNSRFSNHSLKVVKMKEEIRHQQNVFQDTTVECRIDLMKTAYQKRKLTEFMTSYISFLADTKTTLMVFPEELDCLESVFVDASHQQSVDVVEFALENLGKLLMERTDSSLGAATKLCLVLRSVAFSSPGLLQKKATAEKFVISLCDRMKTLKELKSGYRRIIGDLVSEIIVKFFLVVTTYETIEQLDANEIGGSLSKKTSILPWRHILAADDHSSTSTKLDGVISKFSGLASSHQCDGQDEELGISCLPGYCLVDAFWIKFLSNYSLFQRYVSESALQEITDFVRQKWRDEIGTNVWLRRSIIDFVSTLGVNVEDELLADCGRDNTVGTDISDSEMVENTAMDELKRNVMETIKNRSDRDDHDDLNELFSINSSDDSPLIIQKLKMVTFIFESSLKFNDQLKIFFKDWVRRIFLILPELTARSCGNDILSISKLNMVSLELFSSMIADKRLEIPKHPIMSVGLTCCSIIPWERFQSDPSASSHFYQTFLSLLKFLRICQKKCNSLMVSMAPNWMGILRRMQIVLVNILTTNGSNLNCESDDYSVPLFYRLGRFYSNLDQCKELEKISAFMIYDLMILLKQLKLRDSHHDTMVQGIYRLMRICDSYSISMITAMMDDTAKELFRMLYENYQKYYKYTGNV